MTTEKEIEESNKEVTDYIAYCRRKLIHYNDWLLSDRPYGSLYPGFIEDIEPGTIYDVPKELPYQGRVRTIQKKGKK